MIETILQPNAAPLLSHPGSAGFNANRCPACEDRCGDLVNGVCLACFLDWDAATIERYERTEEDTFHNAAEARYAVCGVD